jgi:hypothetical protein
MARFLLDLEIESEVTLSPTEAKLHATMPGSDMDVTVSVAKSSPGQGVTTLSLQLTLDAESIQDARERGLNVAKNFLRAWSFTTSTPFRISAFRRVVDWTPGLRERKCIHFSRHPADEQPHPVLDSETLLSAARLVNAPLSATLRRAIRWFANGVSSNYTDDQFYYFWLTTELVAIETKPPAPVPDPCPMCHGPLYCKVCDLHPTHRPYPKQAIQALFRRHIKDRPDDFFRNAEKFRHALMHGNDVEEVEETTSIKLEYIVNALGRLAWTALLSTIMNKMAAAGESGEFPVLGTNQFVNYELKLGLNLTVTSRDPDHPSLSDLPNIEVSVDSPDQREA